MEIVERLTCLLPYDAMQKRSLQRLSDQVTHLSFPLMLDHLYSALLLTNSHWSLKCGTA